MMTRIPYNRKMFSGMFVAWLLLSSFFRADNPPAVTGVPDQTIGRGGQFDQLNLNQFLTELDGDAIEWSCEMLPITGTDELPNWQVNPGSFQLNMSIIARVTSREKHAVGNSHRLGAFAGNELRGVAEAIPVGGSWLYFVTIYAHTDGEVINFRFFDDSTRSLLPVEQSLAFASNDLVGSPSAPLSIDAGYLVVHKNAEGIIDIKVPDPEWVGSENIRFIATDKGTTEALFDADTALFTIINDHVPLLAGIPDQVIGFGEAFSSFNLNDYLTLNDTDPVSYSFSGANELSINIDANNQVTIDAPAADWIGEETIIFTVQDETANALRSSDTVTFAIKEKDNPPVLTGIADQSTGLGGTFRSIDVADHLAEQDGDDVVISFDFLPPDNPIARPNWQINSGDFQFSMTAIFRVTALGQVATGNQYLLGAFSKGQLRGVAEAVPVGNSWLYFMLIYDNADGDTLDFQLYDESDMRLHPVKEDVVFVSNGNIGSPSQPMSLNAGHLLFSENEGVIGVEIIDDEWVGKESVVFIATDLTTAGLAGRDTAIFEVTNGPFPEIAAIPNQTINEGVQFTDIPLSDYLLQYAPENVAWEVRGNEELEVNIDANQVLSISQPNTDWFGQETLEIIVTDLSNPTLGDAVSVVFTSNNINDAPIFTSLPLTVGKAGVTYAYGVEAIDVDKETPSIRASQLPTWLTLIQQEEGRAIITALPSDAEVGTHAISLEATDAQGAVTIQSFILTIVSADSQPPTITLSNASITEKLPIGSLVSNLAVINALAGDSYTFALVAGDGDIHNDQFFIQGNELRTASVFDYAEQRLLFINLQATGVSGHTLIQSFVISVTPSGNPTALTNEALSQAIRLYPNPVANQVHIDWESPKKGVMNAQLYDATGKLYKVVSWQKQGLKLQTSMDISNYRSGMYWLLIEFDGQYAVKKIQKK